MRYALMGVIGGFFFAFAAPAAALRDNEDWQVWKHGKAGNVFYHLLKSTHAT